MPTQESKWGHIRVHPSLLEKMKTICKQTRRTLSEEIRIALEQYQPKQ